MPNGFKAEGGCRCTNNPIRYEYTQRPYEVHYCLCSDCTAVCGGALAIIAVVYREFFTITQGAEKLKNFDTKKTCHRKFCSECGCHLYLHVDAFPNFELVHIPTLDEGVDAGLEPDRWVFTSSKHRLVTLPDDGLPKFPGWEGTSRY